MCVREFFFFPYVSFVAILLVLSFFVFVVLAYTALLVLCLYAFYSVSSCVPFVFGSF